MGSLEVYGVFLIFVLFTNIQVEHDRGKYTPISRQHSLHHIKDIRRAPLDQEKRFVLSSILFPNVASQKPDWDLMCMQPLLRYCQACRGWTQNLTSATWLPPLQSDDPHILIVHTRLTDLGKENHTALLQHFRIQALGVGPSDIPVTLCSRMTKELQGIWKTH